MCKSSTHGHALVGGHPLPYYSFYPTATIPSGKGRKLEKIFKKEIGGKLVLIYKKKVALC
jgi:hypothetical protein